MQVGNRIRAVALATAGLFVVSRLWWHEHDAARTSPRRQADPPCNDGTEPNSYDPTQQTYTYEAAVGRNVFETLLKSKADVSDVQPAAAESYDVSSDGLTYTFHLRTNAKWSDGKPVTASDLVYGYQHLLNPALAAGYVDPFFDGTIAGADELRQRRRGERQRDRHVPLGPRPVSPGRQHLRDQARSTRPPTSSGS